MTAVIHLTVPREEVHNVMGPGLSELLATVAAQGMTPTGPWFTHHLRMAPDVFDFEIGVPVDAPISKSGGAGQPARDAGGADGLSRLAHGTQPPPGLTGAT